MELGSFWPLALYDVAVFAHSSKILISRQRSFCPLCGIARRERLEAEMKTAVRLAYRTLRAIGDSVLAQGMSCGARWCVSDTDELGIRAAKAGERLRDALGIGGAEFCITFSLNDVIEELVVAKAKHLTGGSPSGIDMSRCENEHRLVKRIGVVG
jgi:hypothetical protein